MILAGIGTYHAVLNQPDLIPVDRTAKPLDQDIGSISARETLVKEISEDGRVQWTLEGSDMSGKVSGSIRMKNPKAIIKVDEENEIELTAPEGNYISDERETILKGGVTAEYKKDKSRFWADEIRFSGKEKKIETRNGTVKMQRDNWEFHAGGMTIDFTGDVIVINMSEPVEIYGYE
jgi:LPS export ABC transporter protein LptC